MTAANYLPEVLETTDAERLATGLIFAEGPLWQVVPGTSAKSEAARRTYPKVRFPADPAIRWRKYESLQGVAGAD
jgi:hypothetical protein